MKKYSDFIVNLQGGAEVWAGLFLFIAVSVFLFYAMGLFISSNRTKLYEYVSSREISTLLNSMMFVSLALTLYISSLMIGEFKTTSNLELIIQSVGSLVIGGLFWYATRIFIKIYYPFYLAKHLAKIRFKKLKSPKNGNAMRLLNEDEEDVHLTKEQIEHEEIFAYDYDVWIDDETGFKIIEKYDVHHTSLVCTKCRFRTLHEINEEILKEPNEDTEGRLVKNYRCDQCGHEDSQEKHIAPLSAN